MPQTRGFYSTRAHYDRIRRQLAVLKNPIVADAVRLMHEAGNEGWYDADPLLDPKYRGIGFSEGRPARTRHEIAHLALELGHTPFQEKMASAFECGFYLARADAGMQREQLERLLEFSEQADKTYYGDPLPEKLKKRLARNPRDLAVAYATGLYLREKFEDYWAAGLHHEKNYLKKYRFLVNYQDSDSVTQRHFPGDEYDFDAVCGRMPAAFLHLSQKEKRAILAVAIGRSKAEDTPYPNRLGMVEKVLQETGIQQRLPVTEEQTMESRVLPKSLVHLPQEGQRSR